MHCCHYYFRVADGGNMEIPPKAEAIVTPLIKKCQYAGDKFVKTMMKWTRKSRAPRRASGFLHKEIQGVRRGAQARYSATMSGSVAMQQTVEMTLIEQA